MPVLELEIPFGPPDAAYPVLEDVIGGTCTLHVSVPQALADIPKTRVVLEWTRAYLATRRS